MLIVVVPVVILAIFIAWHYRQSSTSASYTPNWEHSKMEELIWWSIPFEIVLVLSALTWTSTHQLDPARVLPSNEPPLTVQVVALPWKWLFIYPEEGIASVNELALPVNRSIEFQITGDAPMNSFWIPALGGQMYAMAGMTTILHLIANTPGNYVGRSANYSGEGFAHMQFAVHTMSETQYKTWIQSVQKSPNGLTPETYTILRKPSDDEAVRYYGRVTMPFTDILNASMGDDTVLHSPASTVHMTMPQHP